jgi:hypothetical protein
MRPSIGEDYGDNALFREGLTAAGWKYVAAVKGATSAHPLEAAPQTAPYGGRAQPPKPAYPRPPANLRQLAIACADQIQPVTWRQSSPRGGSASQHALPAG